MMEDTDMYAVIIHQEIGWGLMFTNTTDMYSYGHNSHQYNLQEILNNNNYNISFHKLIVCSAPQWSYNLVNLVIINNYKRMSISIDYSISGIQ